MFNFGPRFLRFFYIKAVEISQKISARVELLHPSENFSEFPAKQNQVLLCPLIFFSFFSSQDKDLSASDRAVSRAFRAMLEEHFSWCVASLEWVYNKGKYLRSHFPPLPVPGFIPQGVAWNMVGKGVSRESVANGS